MQIPFGDLPASTRPCLVGGASVADGSTFGCTACGPNSVHVVPVHAVVDPALCIVATVAVPITMFMLVQVAA